jgi:hypothetical protein
VNPGEKRARSRFEPVLTVGRLNLTGRDRELLVDLYLHRALSRRHLQALYFSSVPRCNQRLRQLFDAGLVRRHFPADQAYGAEAVYSAGPTAVPVVAAGTGWTEETVRARLERDPPSALGHALATADIRLAFAAAASTPPGDVRPVEVERWVPELLCRHEYEARPAGGGPWEAHVFGPDAFVRLTVGSGPTYRDFFIETDLGNTNARAFREKVSAYARYLDTGLFAETYGTGGFEVLTVTTSHGRLRNLIDLTRGCGGPVFRFSTFGDVMRDALGAVWHAAGLGGPAGLLARGD